MDMFALRPESSEHFFITEATYFEQTQRRLPWATKTKSEPKQPMYLATCPECKNAIEIRELDRVRGENGRAPMEPFGKHYPYDVPGLGITYDQTAYENCSLRGKVGLGTSAPRSNKAFNDAILQMLVEQASVVRGVMSNIIGVKIGPKLFDAMMKKFITETRFKCKGVIPSNLPFALVYWMESQSIVGQYIFDADMIAAVNRSKHFRVFNGQIVPLGWVAPLENAKKQGVNPPQNLPWGPHKLAFYLGRRVYRGNESKGEPNRMTLKVTEHENNAQRGVEIFTNEISYYNSHFPKAIAAAARPKSTPESEKKHQADRVQYGGIAFAHISPLLPGWLPSWKCPTPTAV